MVATDVILIPVCTKPGVKHFKPMEIAYFLYWHFKYGCQLIIFSIAFIGPSVTTHHDLNPAYLLYEVDGERTDSTWVGVVCNHLSTMFTDMN